MGFGKVFLLVGFGKIPHQKKTLPSTLPNLKHHPNLVENPKRTATPLTVEIFITAVLIHILSPAHSHNHPTWMHWWYCICFHLSFLLRTLCAGSLFFFLVICPTSHRHTRSRETDWLSDDLCRSFVARHIYLNSKLTTTQSTCFRIGRASLFIVYSFLWEVKSEWT